MKYPHTRVPSWFFALLPELSECELKVMLVAMKHTLGWNRDSDFLSYSLLRDETGMGQASIAKALALLDERGLIKRNTKRIPAQHIQVFPLSPVLPMVVQNMNSDSQNMNSDSQNMNSDSQNMNSDSQNMNSDSQNMNSDSTYYEPVLVQNMNTQKKPPKKVFKETTNIEKLSEEQEESLTLMVDGGVEKTIAEQLIRKAWSRGRDISYIKRILGYVSSNSEVKNPAGMIVSLIERNNDRISVSDRQEAPKFKIPSLDYHLYDDGGLELVKHSGSREDCPVCRAESED